MSLTSDEGGASVGSTSDITKDRDLRRQEKVTVGAIPGVLLRTGYVMLGCATLVLLVLGQDSLRDSLRHSHSLTDRGDADLMLLIVMVALGVLTSAFMANLCVPRRGSGKNRRHRVVGNALMALGIVVFFIPPPAAWLFGDDVWELVQAPTLVASLFLISEGGLQLAKGSYAELKRLVGDSFWRRGWLGIPLRILAALWMLIGITSLAVLLAGNWTIRPGGYCVLGVLALGTAGALAMVAGRPDREVSIDEEGRVTPSACQPQRATAD
jgi:hypothetical protein